MHRDGWWHGLCFDGLTSFQKLIKALLAAELGIERYMTYVVTREIKSACPDLARLTTKAGN